MNLKAWFKDLWKAMEDTREMFRGGLSAIGTCIAFGVIFVGMYLIELYSTKKGSWIREIKLYETYEIFFMMFILALVVSTGRIIFTLMTLIKDILNFLWPNTVQKIRDFFSYRGPYLLIAGFFLLGIVIGLGSIGTFIEGEITGGIFLALVSLLALSPFICVFFVNPFHRFFLRRHNAKN